MQTLVDRPWHVHDFKHLLQVVFLVLLLVEVVCYLGEVNILASKHPLKLFHGPVSLTVELSQ